MRPETEKGEGIELGWKPRTRQEEGARTEKLVAKSYGARLHPRSGAGRIKDDASTDYELLEVKDANRTYSLKVSELEPLRRRAAQQGKSATFIVYFQSEDITATITVTKGRP